jgi:N-acetylneuraminic acid mutarotase
MTDDFEDQCWKDIVTPDVLEVAVYRRKTFVGPAPVLSLRRNMRIAAIAIAGLTVAATVASQPYATRGSWTTKAPLPVARNEVAAVTLNDKIYVLGGSYPRQKYDVADNSEYDPSANRWRTRAPMPHGLNHVGAAALDGKIYVIGGFTGSNHQGIDDGAFVYDPSADIWRALPPLPSPRGSVAVAGLAGKLHALGGRRNENDVVTAHQVYDPATGKWSEAPPLPKGRDHMAAVVVDGKIHLVGGRFGANEDMTGLHDIYDPATNAWTSAPPVPTPRGGGAGALFQGMIVFLGGEDDTRTYDENEGFDLSSSRWVRLAPMPAGRHGFGAAALGKYLYIASGAKGRGGDEPTNELLAFSLP